MLSKLTDAASKMYPYPHAERPRLEETNWMKSWLKWCPRRTGKPRPNNCTRSPTQPITSTPAPIQLKMATHQRIHLGKAQEEQELEKDSEGTPTKTQTFNLIEFLLKNGPPSIISNFKYDLYQLRVFESYSNYVDGTDKGEPSKPSLMQSGNVPKQSSTCSTTNNSSRRKG